MYADGLLTGGPHYKAAGQNIDLVVGVLDDAFLEERECGATFLSNDPLRISISIRHRLAEKKFLDMEDLYGKKVMMTSFQRNTGRM